MKRIILTTMLFCMLDQVIFSQAQTVAVKGKITNEKNEPLGNMDLPRKVGVGCWNTATI